MKAPTSRVLRSMGALGISALVFSAGASLAEPYIGGGPSQAASKGSAKMVAVKQAPSGYRLQQNSPNPFNPSTTITYQLPASGDVTLAIYNLTGQKVRTLIDQHAESGHHTAVWDGQDETGHRVSSGVYVYRLRAGDYVETRRMTLLK